MRPVQWARLAAMLALVGAMVAGLTWDRAPRKGRSERHEAPRAHEAR